MREGNSVLGVDSCKNVGRINVIRYLETRLENGTAVRDGSNMYTDACNILPLCVHQIICD